jgi:hypothetical protein
MRRDARSGSPIGGSEFWVATELRTHTKRHSVACVCQGLAPSAAIIDTSANTITAPP